jgi:hypothetical protein
MRKGAGLFIVPTAPTPSESIAVTRERESHEFKLLVLDGLRTFAALK